MHFMQHFSFNACVLETVECAKCTYIFDSLQNNVFLFTGHFVTSLFVTTRNVLTSLSTLRRGFEHYSFEGGRHLPYLEKKTPWVLLPYSSRKEKLWLLTPS